MFFRAGHFRRISLEGAGDAIQATRHPVIELVVAGDSLVALGNDDGQLQAVVAPALHREEAEGAGADDDSRKDAVKRQLGATDAGDQIFQPTGHQRTTSNR